MEEGPILIGRKPTGPQNGEFGMRSISAAPPLAGADQGFKFDPQIG